MRVYLAAAMTNPGRDLAGVRGVLDCLESDGHVVPTRHVADPQGRAVDGALSDSQVARRDLDWVTRCDAMVAEVSTPSHGVGVEVAAALACAKPVLLVYRRGTPVSRLLLGLGGVETLAYTDVPEVRDGIRSFLTRVGGAPAAR